MTTEQTLNLLIDKVRIMRNYQREYFSLRNVTPEEKQSVLIKSKKAEQEVDSMIRTYIQQSLPFQ